MKLDDFVYETMKQIVDGISRAKDYAPEKGAEINPKKVSFLTGEGTQVAVRYEPVTGRPIDNVEFDVAITTTEGTEDKIGAGIFVAAIGLGAQEKSKSESQSISRIKFAVPILYP